MSDEKVTLNPCQGWGCHEHCMLETHTVDGKIVRTQKYRVPGEHPANEICMKGTLAGKIPYLEDRILYPMKRVGKRGEGKFERISWDEALDTIAGKIKESTEKYGPRSIILNQFWCGYPGDWGSTQNDLIYRFAHTYDATILEYQAVDYGLTFGTEVNFGFTLNNARKLAMHSKNMTIIWGGNPLGYTRPAATTRLFLDSQENGAKIVHISNLYDVTSAKADQWIPIKSGTDAAFALAMCNVMIREDLVDKEYLLGKTSAAYLVRTDTGKYLRHSDIDPENGSPYVFFALDDAGELIPVPHPGGEPFTGYGDKQPVLDAECNLQGIPCKTSYRLLCEYVAKWTPEYQETVTGVPASECEQLARDYVAASPASIFLYYGLRYQNGTQSNRAIELVALLSGNVGKEGGTIMLAGNLEAIGSTSPFNDAAVQFPPDYSGKGTRTTLIDILDGFGDPDKQQYKVWLNCMGNPLLNWPNKDMWRNRILPNLDLFVCWEIRMTDTARYADIVLPETTAFERHELLYAETDNCMTYCEPAIEPLGEAKDCAEIWRGIAERIGIGNYFDHSLKEWVDIEIATGGTEKLGDTFDPKTGKKNGEKPITDEWIKSDKCIHVAVPGIDVDKFDALSGDQWLTDTGRIEFYNEYLAEIGAGFPDFEKALVNKDEIRKVFPLQLYAGRHKYFMQGQFTNMPECRLLADTQFGVALNPIEAAKRNLADGEMVEVFNDRGTMRLPLQLRDDIPVGMAHTWYSFDETTYPDCDCPQDLMHAENTPEMKTDTMEKWGPVTIQRFTEVLGAPITMVHMAGPATPEGIWDNVCDVRKAGE